jgi:hypothetical protein
MRKFKVFVDFEKEEQYLNDMAKQGYILKEYTVFGVYNFAKEEKQDLKYKIDYRTFKKNQDFEDYKALFEDFGWKHIYGTKNSANQFFLLMDENSNNEIFSSKESFAARYKRLYEMCNMTAVTLILYTFVILLINDFNLTNLGFITPGLWERTGFALFGGVLIELPFVFIRLGLPILMAVIGLIYGIWTYKAKKLYNEKKRDN